jgi:hypothetical protein
VCQAKCNPYGSPDSMRPIRGYFPSRANGCLLALLICQIPLYYVVWWLGVIYGETENQMMRAEAELRLVEGLLHSEFSQLNNVRASRHSGGYAIVTGVVRDADEAERLKDALKELIGGEYVNRFVAVIVEPGHDNALLRER